MSQCGTVRNGMEEVLQIPQIFTIGASASEDLM